MTDVGSVLDTTAILANATGSIHVGEVIADFTDELASFAVPLPCLIEADRSVDADHLSGVYLLEAH